MPNGTTTSGTTTTSNGTKTTTEKKSLGDQMKDVWATEDGKPAMLGAFGLGNLTGSLTALGLDQLGHKLKKRRGK